MILNFKRLLKTTGLVAAAACLLMPPLHAQYLSLEEAVEIGLRENLGLVTADSRISAAGVNTGPGAAGMLPSVTAQGSGSFTLDNATQTFLDGRENSIVGGVDLRFNGSVRMDWTIYDGKAMYLRRDQLQDTYELATLAKQATSICKTIAATAVLWPPLARGIARLPTGPNQARRRPPARKPICSCAGCACRCGRPRGFPPGQLRPLLLPCQNSRPNRPAAAPR